MSDISKQPWNKPWIRDFRGVNRSIPSLNDRGFSYTGSKSIQPWAVEVQHFLSQHQARITREAAAFNLPVTQKDFQATQSALNHAQVLDYNSIHKIDPSFKPSDFGLYIEGSIYLQKRFVDTWLVTNNGVRVWEELIHESKHALIDSALGGKSIPGQDDHFLSEWIYPYYINE